LTARILYVSCAEKHEIFILSLDPVTGALSKLGVAVAAGKEGMGTSMAMALSPNRRVLYAAVRTPPMPVSCFAIDAATGSLKLLGAAPLPDQMAYIVTDHTGRHLLGASYHGSQIASSPIGEDDVVRTPATQVMNTPPKAHSILPDPANRFLFAASLGGNVILRLRFDAASGHFDPLPPVRVQEGAGPRHLRFSPDGRFVYLINELGGTIIAYAYDTSAGALAEIQTITALPSGTTLTGSAAAADIHLTPDGRFLYGSVRSTNTLAAYRVDSTTGRLTTIGSVASEPSPRGFAIDPSGRFLLCAGQTSNRVGVYRIDTGTGELLPIGGLNVGGNPNWIEFLS
jgi:6-phosphogluconolactonase